MFSKIVVAFDGSEHSRRALARAAELARCFGSTLWLVHVYPRTSDWLGYEEHAKWVARREAEGQEILAQAHALLNGENLDVRDELLEEPVAEAILSVAETRQASLIVMGSRGFSSLQGLLLGSVSQKVIQVAACPVMVVR